MPKKIPGYGEYQQQQEAKRKAKEAEIQEQNRKKTEKEVEKKAEKLKKAKEKIQDKKIKIVSKNIKLTKNRPTFREFLRGFFIGQMIAFLIGNIDYVFNILGPEYDNGQWTSGGRFWRGFDDQNLGRSLKVPYGEALKNAYGFGDLKDETVRFQVIANLILTILSLMLGTRFAIKNEKIEKNRKQEKANNILSHLEQLKDYGIDVEQLIKDLTPSINKILESLSEIDRRYFDNLAAGGLDKAKYETCVAIISGYLKSHPKEYNKVIEIIDEATLPPEIIKKYGKGKTISFGAAQAMVREK